MNRAVIVILMAASTLLAACGGRVKQDPILTLSANEALAKGKENLAAEKYARARPFFLHAFEVEPNSVNGREALLLAAETFYLEGGTPNYIQAEAKYRDFLNRFPTSERAAYAQFQIANSLAQRMERPDRDQKATLDALETYRELLRLYPTSEYAGQAREKIRLVTDNLAEHEYMVGQFYLRFRLPVAAVGRFEYLLEQYPTYNQKDKVLFYLGQSYALAKREEDSVDAYKRLRQQFPDSPYVAQVPAAVESTVDDEEQSALEVAAPGGGS